MGEFSEGVFEQVRRIPRGKCATYGQIARIHSGRFSRVASCLRGRRSLMGEFSEGVFEQVRRIPRGKCATYGQIARLMGRPRSARYVGYALRSNPAPGADADDVPCHRVVFKDGSLCRGFAFGGPEVQRAMLAEEGVAFLEDGRVDLSLCVPCHRVVFKDGSLCRGFAFGGPEVQRAMLAEEGVAFLEDGRVDLSLCAWDPVKDDALLGPPPGFDWERELGDREE